MSATILRVKRALVESPHEALLLHCKRPRVDTSVLQPSLFIFSGTVNDQEEIPSKLEGLKSIARNIKQTKDASLILSKLREDRLERLQKSRFQLLSYTRGINVGSTADSSVTYIDLLQQENDENQATDYAYDLYLARKENAEDDVRIDEIDSIVKIESVNADLLYNTAMQEGAESSIDSEDSNDENNYRNDYPDTPNGSVDGDDMVEAMENCKIGNELSSDEEDELHLYDEPLVTSSRKPKLSNDDVERFGIGYAKYKARVLVDIAQNPTSNTGYKDDSGDEFFYAKDDCVDCELSDKASDDDSF